MEVIAAAHTAEELDAIWNVVLREVFFRLSDSSLEPEDGEVRLALRDEGALEPGELPARSLVFGAVEQVTVEDRWRLDEYTVEDLHYDAHERMFTLEAAEECNVSLRVARVNVRVLA